MSTDLLPHTDDPRLSQLSDLPPEVQRFVEYLSFLYTPQSPAMALSSYDRFLSAQKESGENLSWWFKRLRELGILKSFGGRYGVAPDLVEDISARSAAHGRAATFCRYLRRNYVLREKAQLVRARWALYESDTAGFQRIVEESRRHNGNIEDDIYEAIVNGCNSDAPLRYWPQAVAKVLVSGALTFSINQARPFDHFWSWWHQNFLGPDDRDGLHQLFLRDLPGIPDGSHLSTLRRILKGDLSELSSLQKTVTEHSVSFPFASQEFVYIVACLAEGNEECVQERLANGSPILRGMIDWFFDIRTGAAGEIDPELLALKKQSDCPPMIRFFLFLLFYWAGFSDLLTAKEVAKLSEAYDIAGYTVLARELDSLACHLSGEADSLSPFLSLLEPQEPWRTRLCLLQSWATEERVDRTLIETRDQRIVWILDPSNCHLTSKVQRIGKSGDWTPGRATAFSDLQYQASDLLSAQDLRVLEALYGSDRGYHRYSSYYGSRTLVDENVLMSLVDHPLLFDKHGEPLRLNRISPSLLIEESRDCLKLSVRPAPSEKKRFALHELDANCHGLAVFNDKQLELLDILTPTGLDIPKSETESIQALLSRTAELGLAVEGCLQAGEEVTREPVDAHLVLRIRPVGLGLHMEVVAQPWGSMVFEPGRGPALLLEKVDGRPVQRERDLAGEKRLYRQLRQSVPELKKGNAYFSHPGECLQLLENLRELPDERYVLQWPKGKKFQNNQEVRWSDLRLSVHGGKDWFTVDTQLKLDGYDHLELSRLLELHRSQGTRFIALDDDHYLTLTQTFVQKLQLLESTAGKQTNGSYRLSPLAASVLFEPEELEGKDEAWEELQQRLASVKALEPTLPRGLRAELRNYQKEGFKWLARSAEWGVGVCLADDMGLGKTVQILALLLHRAKLGPTLVVAPTSVCSNWCEEAHRFTPDLNPVEFRDAERQDAVESAGPGDLVICSYGLLVTNRELLAKVRWANLVLDESQAIKNHSTQRFKAAVSLQADFRIAATGTPVENDLGELWSLFRFLNPGLLGAQRTFASRFGSDPARRGALKDLIAPFLLRRTKENVLPDLPAKTDITLKVELSREERLFYESVRLNALERLEGAEEPAFVGILAELTRLRRACCHPSLLDPNTRVTSSKLERFKELITDLHEAGHRVLVFSQFVDHLSILRREVEKLGLSYRYLDGSTTAKARKRAVKEFQEGFGDLFLISLKAGGTGLNLTQANYVIHMDPWWNPATEDQASDRAHRIGQDKPVTVYRLIGADTVEEKILRLHDEKRELVDNLLSGADRAAKLSTEELMRLLRQSAATTPC